MTSAVICIAVLLSIILCKKIPKIGGNINAALIIAGLLAMLLSGQFSPVSWFSAWILGIDKIAWIICLSISGSIYAKTQVKMGTIDTIMNYFTAQFGNKPRVLIVCILLSLVVAGSLLGDAIAASTVIGILTITTLYSVGIPGEKICAIIVMGAVLGSLMPPISQAFALSSALVNANSDDVLRIAYLTVGIIVLLICIYASKILIKDSELSQKSYTNADGLNKKPVSILLSNWKAFIPLIILVLIVIFRTITIESIRFDLVPEILNQIIVVDKPLLEILSQITIVKGITNPIVLSIIFVTLISFCFKEVKRDIKGTVRSGLKDVKKTVFLQLCAAFMLGAFYAGGQIDAVREFALTLSNDVVKFGGAGAMTLIGMLTGSQSTTQNVIFSFFGPTLVNIGVSDVNAALAGAHLAVAGQGLPPADLTTFCVVGIVGGMIKKDIDPIKVMILCIPMCALLFMTGIIFMYI